MMSILRYRKENDSRMDQLRELVWNHDLVNCGVNRDKDGKGFDLVSRVRRPVSVSVSRTEARTISIGVPQRRASSSKNLKKSLKQFQYVYCFKLIARDPE